MARMIFVNLPVSSLPASMAFYEALGFSNNPQFTDETAACMVWSEAIYVMLLTHDKWRTFTDRPIPPPTSSESTSGPAPASTPYAVLPSPRSSGG